MDQWFLDILKWIVEIWEWLTAPVLYVLDRLMLRGWTRRAVVSGIKKGWGWLVMKFIEQVAAAAEQGVSRRLENLLQKGLEQKTSEWWARMEQKDRERLDRLEQMISRRLAELQPEPPPHGITGTPCPKSGMYRVQGETPWLIERTFEEGDIFPPAPTDHDLVGDRYLGKNETKVTWVYQPPSRDS